MRIPVFVSCPSTLNPQQEKSRAILLAFLEDLQLEPRALGRSDYPRDVPLKEVYVIAKHCHGGIILGFEQFRTAGGMWKRGTKEQRSVPKGKSVSFPTPWNQLEAGILFGLKRPLLIFHEAEITGGIFDIGTTEVFVHPMPPPRITAARKSELKELFLKWHAEVARLYYRY